MQLGDAAVTSIYPSVFNENLLPGGGMDPQKQEDGSFLFFVPVAQLKVRRALAGWPAGTVGGRGC